MGRTLYRWVCGFLLGCTKIAQAYEISRIKRTCCTDIQYFVALQSDNLGRLLLVGRHSKGGSEMAKCECGCGEDVNRGQFLPGHDQRLRTSLEAEVGGLLPLRTLVKAAHSYFDGSINDQTFTQTVRTVFSGTHLPQSTESGQKTCRDEILECAQTVMRQSGLDHFTIPEIISCMAKRESRYAESTIRTHIVSRMCANAPDNHAVTYRDLERTDRGEYRLLR